MNTQRSLLSSITACLALLSLLCLAPDAHAVRVKDIATVSGSRTNQFMGYGLVIGLPGTGDRSSRVTAQSVANMLEQQGVKVDKRQLRTGNVAVVMVTAKLPLSAKAGSQADITVSAVGDSTSLFGGTLLQTPLKGADRNTYAVAQGSLSVGGYSAGGSGASAQKNTSTVAMVPGGATVERNVPFAFNDQQAITLTMNTSDFSTTSQVVQKVNKTLGGSFAKASDASTVKIAVPPDYKGDLVPFIASIENLEITPDVAARVVVNERTGDVVIGGNVRISTVAVAHGNLQVVVQDTPNVSQPGPFSQGQTVVTPQTNLAVKETAQKIVLANGSTLQELVDSLNKLGATPRDIISIISAIKDAGALQAQLIVQ